MQLVQVLLKTRVIRPLRLQSVVMRPLYVRGLEWIEVFKRIHPILLADRKPWINTFTLRDLAFEKLTRNENNRICPLRSPEIVTA
ncbi:hypothetical protein SE91_26475 [Bradyrhizobium sp. DOA1]|nr:hypothetical protein SE91_26475 [Bradyrhizobium sp. DOA1]